MPKAIFFDIDGTLWDRERRIPESTKAALGKLKKNGHLCFICSGRTRAFIPEKELMPLGFDGILAGCGTYGEYRGEVLYYHQIPVEEAARVCEILRRFSAAFVLEGRYGIYLDPDTFPKGDTFPLRMKHAMGDLLLPVRGNEKNLQISKFCVDHIEECREELVRELTPEYRIIYRQRGLLEIVPKGFGKASGIEELCRILHIRREDTYAFGDSTNDLDMLEYAAHSVAMGDGMEEAKQAAEYVTSALWDDGVWNGLLHYGLIE
ncbi:Cof-type HAD-IIB family hydrolase [Hominifimenecus sp. rT4P-3]|uniref:Cof-type HAD-IIB family hydrolase n=1 Tax=Hominifimenecus sp. rT4P-3 TaxID=3242979 RepID=UPI003DA28AF1